MKHYLPGLALLSATASLTAQNPVPNPGFENWTTTDYYTEPSPFRTTNFNSYFAMGLKNVREFSGQTTGSSAYLETLFDGVDYYVGGLFLGDPTQIGSGGIPYTGTPDSVEFSLGYSIPPGDTAYAIFVFNGGTLFAPNFAFITFTGDNAGFHNEVFDIPTFIGVPDSLLVIITSGNISDTPVAGGWLKVDDITFTGTGQQLPNKSFDNWTMISTENPNGWNTSNLFSAISYGTPSATKSSDKHSGNSALSLETVETSFFGGIDTLGYVTNGNLFELGGPEGGTSINFQPKRFSFWYKYAPVGNDTALALAGFTRYNIGSGQTDSLLETPDIKLSSKSSYTKYEYFFNWTGIPQIPDTMLIAFASSNFEEEGNYKGIGSTLLIDDVVLDNETAVMDLTNQQFIQFWPVPAHEVITLSIRTKSSANDGEVRLSDILGRSVLYQPIIFNGTTSAMRLDVSSLNTGVYVWEVELNGARYSGMVQVN